MYDYDDYYNENIYEPSPLDNLMQEYREKCKTILLASVQSEIDAIKERNSYLEEENKKLRKYNHNTQSQLSLSEKELSKVKIFSDTLNNVKQNINSEKDSYKRDNMIFEFLSFVFEQDYNVRDEYNAPLWIRSLAAFYSHKQEVIELLGILDYSRIPENINNFRLPVDWDEQEMDIFFNTLNNHSCTNGNTYENNLQWYGSISLDSVDKQCHRSSSQIPWQFVLRNPLLKQTKYLERMGKEIVKLQYSNGNKFNKICNYQALTDGEIKIIVDNLDFTIWSRERNDDTNSFILANLRVITNEHFLNRVYKFFEDSYDFKCQKKILDMPFEFLLKWTKTHKDTVSEWLRDNKMEINKEQRRELMEIILE